MTIHLLRGKDVCGEKTGGRIQISSNRGGTKPFGHRVWYHGELPRYEPSRWGPRPTRDRIHLVWAGPIFLALFPRERKTR